MRRRLVLVLAWAAATAVAVAGSWVGLQPVLAATVPELPTRLSASQLREAAPVTPSPTSSPTPSPTPTPTESPSPSPEPSPAPRLPEPPASSDWKRLDHTERTTFERTFVLRGGEVVVRVSRREVEVVSHTANPGYEVSVTRWFRGSVTFAFESVERTSRVWIMWRDGPYAEVTETQ